MIGFEGTQHENVWVLCENAPPLVNLRPAQDAEALSHAVLNNEPVLPDSLVQGQQGFEDLRDAPAPDVEEDDEQHFAFTERMKEWWSSALTWVTFPH